MNTYDESNCPDELRRGLAEIKTEYSHRFSKTSNVRKISFVKENIISNKLSVIKDGINVTLRYYHRNHAFRALDVGSENLPMINYSRAATLSYSYMFSILT